MSSNKMSTGEMVAIGFMLFALFFGAGNLIFPPALGKQPGRIFGQLLLDFY